eukprot:1302399-Prymnesium_polylepis.1
MTHPAFALYFKREPSSLLGAGFLGRAHRGAPGSHRADGGVHAGPGLPHCGEPVADLDGLHHRRCGEHSTFPRSVVIAVAALSHSATSTRAPGSPVADLLPGVEFDTVAREWRMKWSGDDDKASLAAAQKVLDETASTLKEIPGVKSVQRV